MSGRPYTYSRGQAIAHLMQDRRRPIIKKLAEEKHGAAQISWLPKVYILEDDIYIAMTNTIEWLDRLYKVESDGTVFGNKVAGWPTEEEIADCIAKSAEREKQGGGISTNDILAIEELRG